MSEEAHTETSLEQVSQLEWLWKNCIIVYFPPGGSYAIEHNLAAKKDSRRYIEAEMARHLKTP